MPVWQIPKLKNTVTGSMFPSGRTKAPAQATIGGKKADGKSFHTSAPEISASNSNTYLG